MTRSGGFLTAVLCKSAARKTPLLDASAPTEPGGYSYGRDEPCSSTRAVDSAKKRFIVLYLDGNRFQGDLGELNSTIAMNEVLAIETYPDVAIAPPIWRTPDACAVIAVWMKH